MQYGEGRMGRIFALRLEEGEPLNKTIESFARDQGIKCGMAIYLGGGQHGSKVVVGPEAGRGSDIIPIIHTLQGIQEVAAVGTIFPNEAGEPSLHMHAASGREGGATVGCTRAGVEVWLVGEVIIIEIMGTVGVRKKDPATGFHLLGFE